MVKKNYVRVKIIDIPYSRIFLDDELAPTEVNKKFRNKKRK